MISTVTTTTVSTVTTVSLATSLGLIVVVTLLSLMIQKEFATIFSSPRAKALGRALNTAIVPLLMVFVLLLALKFAELFA